MPLTLSTSPLELPLKHTFKISRREANVAHTVLVRATDGEYMGLGEATPIARYDETVETVQAYFATHALASDDPFQMEALLRNDIPAAARSGLDIALHDLIGKRLGIPLYAMLGLDPAQTPATSFTIGIADTETTLRKVDEVGEHPIIKVKVGLGGAAEQIELVEAIRDRYTGTIRLDANEGWNVETAISILREMFRFDIEFCEQPVPAGSPASLRAIHEAVKIPIVADEDSRNANDLFALAGCVNGASVKLAKCGGIRGALKMIHTARAMRLRVMLGSMVESAIAATAAAHLSPLVDWADIDGPFLTASDPYAGVTYDGKGKLLLPHAPGLGVSERVAA